MAISQIDIERIISLTKAYGGTRLILFGSALQIPDEARDIDLACDGILGWKLYESVMGQLLGENTIFYLSQSTQRPQRKIINLLNLCELCAF